MNVGDRVRTPLGWTGVVTGFYELSTGKTGAHVRFDPRPNTITTGVWPLEHLTLIDEESNDNNDE